MQYKANDGSDVKLERWGWIVTYKDNTQHQQFDGENGIYNNFASIDLPAVKSITMQNFFTDKQFTLAIPDGAKLIHYYDNIIKQPQGGGAIHYRLYCFGYEMGGDKKIWTILPKDEIVLGTLEDIEVM